MNSLTKSCNRRNSRKKKRRDLKTTTVILLLPLKQPLSCMITLIRWSPERCNHMFMKMSTRLLTLSGIFSVVYDESNRTCVVVVYSSEWFFPVNRRWTRSLWASGCLSLSAANSSSNDEVKIFTIHQFSFQFLIMQPKLHHLMMILMKLLSSLTFIHLVWVWCLVEQGIHWIFLISCTLAILLLLIFCFQTECEISMKSMYEHTEFCLEGLHGFEQRWIHTFWFHLRVLEVPGESNVIL